MAFGLLYSGHVNLGDIIMVTVVHIASEMTLSWLVICVLLIGCGLWMRFKVLKRGTNENEISRCAFGVELYCDSVGKPEDIVFRPVFIW